MTSTVKVSAHCAPDKRVSVVLETSPGNNECHILKDGEVREWYVYDARSITVNEFTPTAEQHDG